jgi:hypothetical protein
VVLLHFFPAFSDWLGNVRDPRQSGRAVFPFKVLLLHGVLMFLSHTGRLLNAIISHPLPADLNPPGQIRLSTA